MIKIILVGVLLISSVILPQKKKDFDIVETKLNKSTIVNSDNMELTNDYLEMTMISGGYFTIGTSNGNNSTRLDNNCQITYGHPYAMTSFPVFSVDGKWMKREEISGIVTKNGDTLSFNWTSDAGVSFQFSMVLQSSGVKFIHSVINLDTVNHEIGTGLFFDPALGKWGDGGLYVNNKVVINDTLLNFSDTAEMDLWEKNTGARGIGVQLSANQSLKVLVNNWRESFNNYSPEPLQSSVKKIYDMVLRLYFRNEILAPRQEKKDELELLLPVPDFSSDAFTRWDVPAYLDLTDNLMFPRQFQTFAEVNNNKLSQLACDLSIEISGSITANKTSYQLTVPGSSSYFNKIDLQSKLSFEERVVTATLVLKSNNAVVDEVQRNIYIPATPVSDTGLVIVDDSLASASFPKVDLFFAVEHSYSGQRILNLTKENIYVYENGSRIEDYNLSKLTSGGSPLADVVFVLDVSGSMGDKILQVKNNINEFGDSLEARGYDYKMGIVTFSTTVDNVWDLTKDLEFLKNKLSSIVLWGGVEDSPSALMAASNLAFRPGSKRTIIWVTDEEYPEDKYTKSAVIDQMLLKDITVHGVGPDYLQTTWFSPIIIPTGGNFYNIYGKFRDILLDVSRMEASDMYHVSYQSKLQSGENKELTLKVFFGGSGVVKSYVFNSNQANEGSTSHLKYYPNPFNPEITIKVNTGNYIKGEIRIFSILGECVKTFKIDQTIHSQFTWNARNEMGLPVSTGFYIVQLIMTDINENIYTESAKIIFLK